DAPAGTLYAGDSLTLVADAGGTQPLTYQWRKDTLAIGGATTSSYSVAAVGATDAGAYDVVVSNASGSTNSGTATIVVTPQIAPSFTRNLVIPSRTIYSNGSIKMSVAAVGGGITYQWKKNGSD